ncbi:MAG: methyltransferase domain-containing protein [Cyclobacteriaceae bacterium]|nr:methyltransferase domain-containing protein [Cyclobacteriaceae bacterium]
MRWRFPKRSQELEIMDDLQCRGEVVRRTLRELDFINQWLGGNAITLGVVRQLLSQFPDRPLRILDAGCGSGDMLRRMAILARRSGRKIQLIGVDANPHIVEMARKDSEGYPEISFLTLDIFSEEFRNIRADILTGTLFFHHFDNQQLQRFFRQLDEQIALAVVINDLHRHPLAYYSIRWLTRWFSSSPMVQFDAPLSVLRGFNRSEWESITAGTGWRSLHIRWRWAFRWLVILRRNAVAS